MTTVLKPLKLKRHKRKERVKITPKLSNVVYPCGIMILKSRHFNTVSFKSFKSFVIFIAIFLSLNIMCAL